MTTSDTSLRAPTQQRSRNSLDRMLSATEELLKEKEFDEITITEIVARSGTSTGAFYARFGSKEALLPALYDRLTEQVRANTEMARDDSLWGERSLVHRIRFVAARIVGDMRAGRHILRPLGLYTRRNPKQVSAADRQARGGLHRVACNGLLECREEIRHPDPEAAVDFILYAMLAIGRDKILFGDAPHASTVQIDDTRLEREMAAMALAYLGVRTEER
jgi:AcrR family transcriptional regulator